MSEPEDTAYTDTELLRMAVAGYARGSEALLPAFDAMVTHAEALEGALGYLLKQIDEVERSSVIRESDTYRHARAALAGEPTGATQDPTLPCCYHRLSQHTSNGEPVECECGCRGVTVPTGTEEVRHG